MATTVQDILTQMDAIAVSTLGSSYRKLRRVFDVLENDERDARFGYGSRPLSASPFPGVTGLETLEQEFEFIISDTWARGDSDAEAITSINNMYDKLDSVYKQFISTKINLPGTVVQVGRRSIEEPIVSAIGIFIQIRFPVVYRQTL